MDSMYMTAIAQMFMTDLGFRPRIVQDMIITQFELYENNVPDDSTSEKQVLVLQNKTFQVYYSFY